MSTEERKMPAPQSLGGGFITMFRCGGIKPGACTSPACQAKATRKCGYALSTGKPCDRPVCDKHAHALQIGKAILVMCPPHARLVEKTRLYP
jgi:hypothetical protein